MNSYATALLDCRLTPPPLKFNFHAATRMNYAYAAQRNVSQRYARRFVSVEIGLYR